MKDPAGTSISTRTNESIPVQFVHCTPETPWTSAGPVIVNGGAPQM
ncbi:MAG: hypothetical protein IPG92_13950 [Flavobacteriales bacterium]|nr:hypothetical protein [Flavobacteriales bacterium]